MHGVLQLCKTGGRKSVGAYWHVMLAFVHVSEVSPGQLDEALQMASCLWTGSSCCLLCRVLPWHS